MRRYRRPEPGAGGRSGLNWQPAEECGLVSSSCAALTGQAALAYFKQMIKPID